MQNYLSYIEEAYLVFILNRFSYKIREQIKTPKKVYLVDNGFCSKIASRFSSDFGKLMENTVFLENIRRGFKPGIDFFYLKTQKGKEIDFLLKDGIKIGQLIQVCYRIDNQKTKEREIKALLEAASELSCCNLLIITWDYEKLEKHNGKEIKFLPLRKWLLG